MSRLVAEAALREWLREAMSLLSVVQDAMVRMNLPKPLTAFANADATVQQMVSFAQDVGDELSERYFWRSLNVDNATITGDGSTTLWPIPPDFGQLSPGLEFISAAAPNFCIVGPVTNEQMNRLKALSFIGNLQAPLMLANGIDQLSLEGGGSLLLSSVLTSSAPISFTAWRVLGSVFEFWPALDLGEVVSYSYYSQNWIQPALVEGNTQARIVRYAADSDSSVIDERLQTSGVIWRWLAAKGLDYAEEFRRFEDRLSRAMGRESTIRVVRMSRRLTAPDNWFPGTILDLTEGSS